jgi:monoamine oxidase
VVEVGGQWTGPTQDHLGALAEELGVERFATYGEGEYVIEYSGSIRRYKRTIPRINPLVLLDVRRAQHKPEQARSPGALLGFLEGRHARELGRRPPDERRAAVVDCFARLFGPRGGGDARTPTSSAPGRRRNGRAAATAATCPRGLDELRTSAPRAAGSVALWAGAEYATVWNGYMDGAVRSGQHAAREALERL